MFFCFLCLFSYESYFKQTIYFFQPAGSRRNRPAGQQAAVGAVHDIRVGERGQVGAGSGGRGQRAGPHRALAAAAAGPLLSAPRHAALSALHQGTDRQYLHRCTRGRGQV